MSGSQSSMLHKGSVLIRTFARAATCALFLMTWAPQSFGQVSFSGPQTPGLIQGPSLPPLDVPINRLPARDPSAISVDGWLLYPSLKIYSLYSDNLFLAPQSPISAAGIGVTPSLAAVWSHGIHTTT